MKRCYVWVLSGILSAAAAGEEPVPEPAARFAWIDVFIDAKQAPLAAYTFELAGAKGRMAIVGIENGEHPAFVDPPNYDAKALREGRIVLTARSSAKDAPTGRTRVATVNALVTGEAALDYQLTLVAAATPDGTPIPATISAEKGGTL